MRRYFYNDPKYFQIGDSIHIEGDLFHHIVDVCRQSIGSKFEIINSNGNAYFCEIKSISKRNAVLLVHEMRSLPKPSKPLINLILSIPKFSTFETIIEKSVELGVANIFPVVSDFSFIKNLTHLSNDKYNRWNKIITQATQQSARGDLLKIHPIQSLKSLIESSKLNSSASDFSVFAFEGECEIGLKQQISDYKSNLHAQTTQNNSLVDVVWIIVGSEGGFSINEVEFLKSQDLHPVSLGQQVLRVETACLALISILKYEFVI